MGKKKVVSLNPSEIEEQIMEGKDPRENMTEEEIMEFMKKEADALNQRISRFVQEVPLPETKEINEDEEDEEEEVFTLDLENKTLQQKESATIIGEAGTLGAEMIVRNPYTDLITSVFLSKALAQIVLDIKEEQIKLESLAEESSTPEQRKALMETSRAVYDKQIHEIRSCWINGTNRVKFEKIPEWAKPLIEDYIDRKIRDLLQFVSEWNE